MFPILNRVLQSTRKTRGAAGIARYKGNADIVDNNEPSDGEVGGTAINAIFNVKI